MRDYAHEADIAAPAAEPTPNPQAIQPMAAMIVGTTAHIFGSRLVSSAALATQIALSLFACVALVAAVWVLTT